MNVEKLMGEDVVETESLMLPRAFSYLHLFIPGAMDWRVHN